MATCQGREAWARLAQGAGELGWWHVCPSVVHPLTLLLLLLLLCPVSVLTSPNPCFLPSHLLMTAANTSCVASPTSSPAFYLHPPL